MPLHEMRYCGRCGASYPAGTYSTHRETHEGLDEPLRPHANKFRDPKQYVKREYLANAIEVLRETRSDAEIATLIGCSREYIGQIAGRRGDAQ